MQYTEVCKISLNRVIKHTRTCTYTYNNVVNILVYLFASFYTDKRNMWYFWIADRNQTYVRSLPIYVLPYTCKCNDTCIKQLLSTMMNLNVHYLLVHTARGVLYITWMSYNYAIIFVEVCYISSFSPIILGYTCSFRYIFYTCVLNLILTSQYVIFMHVHGKCNYLYIFEACCINNNTMLVEILKFWNIKISLKIAMLLERNPTSLEYQN